MIIRTHISFSWLILFGLLAVFDVVVTVWTVAAITIGAVIPDIDTRVSTVGKIFPNVAKKIERKWGHRTITHSWISLMIGGIVLIVISNLLDYYMIGIVGVKNNHIAISFIVGWFTHIFLDTMTVQGVKVFFPVSNRKAVFPFDPNFPYSYRTYTGSKIDKILFFIFLFGAIVTFPIGTIGYQRIIRTLQQDIQSGVNDYNEMARNNLVYAEIRGKNPITKEEIEGTYNVIGTLSNRSLLIEKEDEVYTFGDGYKDLIYCESVQCFKGEEISLEVKSIEIRDDLLKSIFNNITGKELKVILHGDIEVVEDENSKYVEKYDVYNTIVKSGNRIKLSYAREKDIYKYGIENAFVTKGNLKMYCYNAKNYKGDDRVKIEDYTDKNGIDEKNNLYETVVIIKKINDLSSLLVKVGDSVYVGKEIIRERKYEKGNENVGDEIAIIESRRDLEINQLQREIETARKDTLLKYDNMRNTLKLFEQGYKTEGHLEKAKRELEEVKNKYFGLIRQRDVKEKDYQMKIYNLMKKTEGSVKDVVENAKVNGIIEDITTRITEDNKYQVKISIRVGGNHSSTTLTNHSSTSLDDARDNSLTKHSSTTLTNQNTEDRRQETDEYRVERVIDGDTFEIIYNGKKQAVRLIGIDAPESNPKRYGYVEEYGEEAKEFLVELIEGKNVLLQYDIQKYDKYSRLLAYVYLNDIFVNEILVKKGVARVTTYPPNVRFVDRLTEAQQGARERGEGFWKKY